MRLAATLACGLIALGALATVASDPWLAAGYAQPSRTVMAGGTESDWLRAAPDAGLKPAAVTVRDHADPAHLTTKAFGIGTRLLVRGAETLRLDVISAVPAPADSGLVDGEGRALLIVTARERGGVRLIRLLVEADRLAGPAEKSL